MTSTYKEPQYLSSFSTKASILAGLVTLSFTPSTESGGDGSVLTSAPTSTETEIEQPRRASHVLQSEGNYISVSGAPLSESFGSEVQDLVTRIEVRGIMNELEEYRDLEQDWNGYGAPPIPDDVIDLAKEIAARSEIAQRAPEVFPTGRETVQFEFVNKRGDEAELEIFGREDSIVVVIREEGEVFERRTTLQDSIALLNDLLA